MAPMSWDICILSSRSTQPTPKSLLILNKRAWERESVCVHAHDDKRDDGTKHRVLATYALLQHIWAWSLLYVLCHVLSQVLVLFGFLKNHPWTCLLSFLFISMQTMMSIKSSSICQGEKSQVDANHQKGGGKEEALDIWKSPPNPIFSYP